MALVTRRFVFRALLYSCCCLALLSSTSCETPESVARFAAGASQALNQGIPIFQDLHGSCVRRHADAADVTALFRGKPSTDSSSPVEPDVPACAQFQAEEDGLIKASGVLSAYFSAIQQLASFDTSSVKAPSETLAERSAAAANLSTTQAGALGKLAAFVTRVSTGSYQRHHLREDLRQADASISAATEGFEKIAKDYEGLLLEERRAIRDRYQEMGDTNDQAIVFLLNRTYTDEIGKLDRRKRAAEAYIEALEQIREGHHELARNVGPLNGKKLGATLQPFTLKLERLAAATIGL